MNSRYVAIVGVVFFLLFVCALILIINMNSNRRAKLEDPLAFGTSDDCAKVCWWTVLQYGISLIVCIFLIWFTWSYAGQQSYSLQPNALSYY